MSRYVSRALADRRRRQGTIAKRVGLCAFLLVLAALSGMTSYVFMAFGDQIAANTHDTHGTIAWVALWSGILAFISLLAVPIVASGILEV